MKKKQAKEVEKNNKKLEVENEAEKKKVWWKELLPYVIIVVVVFLIRTFLVTPAIVSGISMNPTLKNNELMLVKKYDKVERNKIVVFKYQDDYLIKRVIGMPKDKIACENGIIYINDHKYEDKYSTLENTDFEPIVLGKDEYFVMGDNRGNSLDSRVFGPVKENKIIGTTNLVIYPFSKVGKVK